MLRFEPALGLLKGSFGNIDGVKSDPSLPPRSGFEQQAGFCRCSRSQFDDGQLVIAAGRSDDLVRVPGQDAPLRSRDVIFRQFRNRLEESRSLGVVKQPGRKCFGPARQPAVDFRSDRATGSFRQFG